MTVDKVLAGGRLFIEGEILEGALAIDEGKIAWIGKESGKPAATETLQIDGRLVLPGIIDLHVHLRDQGLSRKEDFSSGTKAAAIGGMTSIVDMPNNDPPTDTPGALEERMRIAEGNVYVNTGFYSLLRTDESIFAAISQRGPMGFKFYMYNLLDGLDPEDDDLLEKTFRTLQEKKSLLAIHAESRTVLSEIASKMTETELQNPENYPNVRPQEAEAEAVSRVARIAGKVGNRIHICHLSTRASVDIVREAKEAGVSVTCEVTPHHLLISKSQMRRLGSEGIVNPPLRSRNDVLSLWEGVNEGTVDVLASDHAPHERSEKQRRMAKHVPPGFPGLETLAATMLTQVNLGRISLRRFVQMTSTAPARILGLEGRGSLKKGYHADLIIVDLKEEGSIDPSKFKSKAKYSPFEGYKTKGKVTRTILGGRVVMEEGEIVASEASGKILRKGQR